MKAKYTSRLILSAMVMIAVLFQACGTDSGSEDLNIESMTVAGMDLNAAQAPEGVPADAMIEITFNSNVQTSTATESNISLVQDYNGENISLDIAVNGATITITPQENLGSGALYQLTLGSGLLNEDDQPLASTSRSFRTAGTFAPPGAIAYYSFEGSADDEMGNYNPSASGVIDINYVDSRNSEAGQAAEFNGTSSIIEVPGAPEIASTGKLTLSFWVKPDSSAHGGGNFVIGVGGLNGFVVELNKSSAKMAAQYELLSGSSSQDIWIDGTGNLGFEGWTYSRDFSSQGGFAEVVQNKWTHFVFQYDSETKVGKAYINGELAKSQDFNQYPTDHPFYNAGDLTFNSQPGLGENMAIGYYSDVSTTIYDWADYNNPDSNHYAGLMDDVIIYHKVLSETEIQLMYDSGK